MKASVLLLLSGCGFILPAFAPAAAEAPALSDHVISDDNYPERKVAFPGGVTGLPDLTYETLSGYRPMKLDLYLPPASFAGPRPFVIYIHGGGWANGIPRTAAVFANWPDVLASFAARGYVTASVSYRFQNEAPFPAAIQDVKAAIRWLHSNAEKYNIDTTRGMTLGSSAADNWRPWRLCHAASLRSIPRRLRLAGRPPTPTSRKTPPGRWTTRRPIACKAPSDGTECMTSKLGRAPSPRNALGHRGWTSVENCARLRSGGAATD
jgi:hypothetical protein